MAETELFVQGEGMRDIALVRVPEGGTVRDVVEAARAHGLRTEDGETLSVTVENDDTELDLDASLSAAGIADRGRVHVHRCKKVAVTVNFNARQATDDFPPSTTVKRLKKWADSKKGFDLRGADATEHLLQLCGSGERPDEDTHIGSLAEVPDCSLCFDLVPKSRVEG
jgi:hypothetical protein